MSSLHVSVFWGPTGIQWRLASYYSALESKREGRIMRWERRGYLDLVAAPEVGDVLRAALLDILAKLPPGEAP